MQYISHAQSNHMGNYPKSDRPFLEQAASETGFKIRISDYATDVHGQPIPDDIAVYTKEPTREHGPFWRRFRELKDAAESEAHDQG